MQVPIATRRFVFIPMDLQDLSVGLLQVPNKQWGASGYAVTFPIAFNVVYNVLSIPQTTASTSNAYWGRFYITALNKNGFNVSDTGAGSNRWIAIGSAQPQWGYYVESQNPTDYRYWSIPFTSHYITMATKTYYEPKEEAVPWLVGIDMQKFICGYGANFIGSSYVSCVGIGCQPQWGINTGGAVRTSTLPIPFTNVFLAVASTSSEWCCPGCSATNTTVTTRAYQSNRPDVAQLNDVNWIIIGCQPQWGYCSSRTATFPIPFPTAALFIVAVPKTTSTSATATGAEYLGTTSVNLYLHGTSGWYFVGGH